VTPRIFFVTAAPPYAHMMVRLHCTSVQHLRSY
jgi:hypothetical protein